MTPQEALAQAIFDAADPNFRYPTRGNCDRFAAAILAALPEGWVLVMYDSPLHRQHEVIKAEGAQQERERWLKALVVTPRFDSIRHGPLSLLLAAPLDALADPEEPDHE